MKESDIPFPGLKTDCVKLEEILSSVEQWARKHEKAREKGAQPLTALWRQQVAQKLAAAAKLAKACELPPSVGLYGQTGSGKSTLVGWWLGEKRNQPGTALAFPAELEKLTFLDINPNKPQEATAVVTRFTASAAARERAQRGKFELRPLSVQDFLLVLGAAFDLECKSDRYWSKESLRDFLAGLNRKGASRGEWKAVSAAQLSETVRVLAEEFELPRFSRLSGQMGEVSGLLRANENALSQIAPTLLWDDWEAFSTLWSEAVPLLESFDEKEAELPFDVLPFLLDSSCPSEISGLKALSSKGSKVRWVDVQKSLPPYLREDLKLVQTVAAEAVLGIHPDRLPPFAGELSDRGDILDIPGLVPIGGGGGPKLAQDELDGEGSNFYRAIRRGKELVLFTKYSREHILQHVCFLLSFKRSMVPGAARHALRIFAKSLVPPGTENPVQRLHQESPDAGPPITLGLSFAGAVMNDIARGDVDSLAVMLNKIAPESLGTWWDWPGGFRQINLTRYPHLVSDENLTDPASSGKNFLSEPVVAKYLQNPKRLWQSLADDQDCGISTLIRDLAKHLSLEKRQGFLKGQLGSLGKQSDVLLREQFVDSSAEEEARKRRKFGTSLAKDLEAVKAPRLVMAALRKTLRVDESLASRARASLQKESRAGKSGENGTGPGETWLRMTLDLHSSYVASKPDDLPLVAARYLDAGRMVQLSRWLSDAAVRSEGETINRLYADFARLYGDDRSAFDEVGATWASFSLWGRYFKLSPHPTPAEARQRMTQRDAPAQRLLARWLDLLPEFLAEGVGKVVAAPAGNDALGEVIEQLAAFLQSLQRAGS